MTTNFLAEVQEEIDNIFEHPTGDLQVFSLWQPQAEAASKFATVAPLFGV